MEYDSVLMSVSGDVTNTLLDTNSAAWLQASLPVRLGGLRVRQAVDVAPAFYLQSMQLLSWLMKFSLQDLPSLSYASV